MGVWGWLLFTLEKWQTWALPTHCSPMDHWLMGDDRDQIISGHELGDRVSQAYEETLSLDPSPFLRSSCSEMPADGGMHVHAQPQFQRLHAMPLLLVGSCFSYFQPILLPVPHLGHKLPANKLLDYHQREITRCTVGWGHGFY